MANEARVRFGNRVRTIRQEKGITQEDLAELIGKSIEHISFIERGERSPSFEVILDSAEALNVSVPYLMNFDQPDEDADLITALIASPVSPELVAPVQEPVKEEAEGNEYELKTINRSLNKNAGVTTHHHLNKDILAKYRAVKAWYIAVYEGIELIEIYKVFPEILEEKFSEWEKRLDTMNSINNPKIPMKLIRRGELVYSCSSNSYS